MKKDFKSPVSTVPPRGQRVVSYGLSPDFRAENRPSQRQQATRQVGTDAQEPAQGFRLLPRTVLTPEFQTVFWSRVNTAGDCWEWCGSYNSFGYGRVRPPGSRAHFLAHRISYLLDAGVDPETLCVCHTCDNPKCVRPDHLFLGTPADNSADKMAKGRNRTGDMACEKNPNATLRAADVARAVEMMKAGKNNKEIAAVFGVSHAIISRIRLGRAWRPVTEAMGYVPKPCPSAPKSGKTGVKKWT